MYLFRMEVKNMNKIKLKQLIYKTGIIPVVRATSPEHAMKIMEAIRKGGINIIEITMTVPGAIEVIKKLNIKYKNNPEIIIGAGSVLDSETTRNAILAGAEFIVGPTLNEKMVKTANRYQKLVIPGAMTPKEVLEAMEAGADLVKIFPATLFGPKIVKAIKGPLPQAELVPTGGVNLKNIEEWIKAGSYAVGAGSAITKGAENGNYEQVKTNTANFVELIKKHRKHIN